MKPDTHPNYNPVVFRDASADFAFLTRSTVTSSKTIEWEDGNTYPVIDIEVSSKSHPFYTGKRKLLDSGGRLGRFQAKLEAAGTGAPSKKKKSAASRTFAPAVDPKALAARAARAEARAIEEAKQRKEAEEAEKRAAEEAAAAAKAEAEAAAAAAAEAEAAEQSDAAAAESAEADAATENAAEAGAESKDEAPADAEKAAE